MSHRFLTDRRDELAAEIAALANEIEGLECLEEAIEDCNRPVDAAAWRAWEARYMGAGPVGPRPPWTLDDLTGAICRQARLREAQLADAYRELEEVEDEIADSEAAEFRRDFLASVL